MDHWLNVSPKRVDLPMNFTRLTLVLWLLLLSCSINMGWSAALATDTIGPSDELHIAGSHLAEADLSRDDRWLVCVGVPTAAPDKVPHHRLVIIALQQSAIADVIEITDGEIVGDVAIIQQGHLTWYIRQPYTKRHEPLTVYQREGMFGPLRCTQTLDLYVTNNLINYPYRNFMRLRDEAVFSPDGSFLVMPQALPDQRWLIDVYSTADLKDYVQHELHFQYDTVYVKWSSDFRYGLIQGWYHASNGSDEIWLLDMNKRKWFGSCLCIPNVHIQWADVLLETEVVLSASTPKLPVKQQWYIWNWLTKDQVKPITIETMRQKIHKPDKWKLQNQCSYKSQLNSGRTEFDRLVNQATSRMLTAHNSIIIQSGSTRLIYHGQRITVR